MISKYKPLQQKVTEGRSRKIPFMLNIKVLLGDVVLSIGASFAVFGIIFLIVFGFNVNFNSYKIKSDSPEIHGIIYDIKGTNTSINEQTVLAYHYEYSIPDGKHYTGISYKTGEFQDINDTVVVQYVAETPEISVIQGANTSIFSPLILLSISIFPIIGIALFGYRIIAKTKDLYLLKYGEIAVGKLINTQPTNTSINKKTVYKFTFKFKAKDGNKYQGIIKTHRTYAVTDDKEETLLYDPKKPTKIVMLDTMPYQIKNYFKNTKEL